MSTKEEQMKKTLERIKMTDVFLDGFKREEYKKVSIQDISKVDVGKKIFVFGWVTASREGKKVSFFDLTAFFKTVKCVIEAKTSLTFQTSLLVHAIVAENKGKDGHDFELLVQGYEIFNGYQAPPFPLNRESEKETWLDNAHLGLRMKQRSLFIQAQSQLLRSLREHYFATNHYEITPPTLVQTQVEGGATLFGLDYYGEKAYLTQSSQLYLETVAPVAGKAFCIMPSYRAEKSKTSRHLSEFTHVEAELADITFDELMYNIEQLLRTTIKSFYAAMLDKIREIDPDFEPVVLADAPFKRITYKDAIDFLHSKGHLKTDGTPYVQGDDIADASERFLLETYGENQPVFLTRFPEEHKPFYVSKDEEGTQTCDLLFPGIGETVGASMRHTVYEDLVKGFEREGISPDPYYWYLDMAKYGPCPHGGYGLGFERLLMCLMKYKNVDQSTLYCRKVSRCTP